MLIQRVAGFLRGKPLLARMALRCVPDVHWTLRLPELGPFQIRLRRHRSYWLRHPLHHEGFVLGAFARSVRPGDVVYDVGANVGLHLRVLASRFRAGRVYGFEPMRENFSILERNVALGNLADRARLLRVALGDTDGEEDLQIDSIMSQSAALNSVTGGRPSSGHERYGLPARTERVTVARLDTLIERSGLERPDFIKIDVEGAEAMVLRGARNLLASARPRMIVELHGPGPAREAFEELDRAGYACFGYLRGVYRRITGEDVRGLEGPYDLMHVVASADPRDYEQPIEPVDPTRPAAPAGAASGSGSAPAPAG